MLQKLPAGKRACQKLPTGKRTRSSAPAQNCIQAHQNCIQAHQLVSTPVQAHLYPSPPTGKRTRSSAPNQNCIPFKRTCSELYSSPPTGKHTRSSAPAQNCIQAHQLVSTPVQVHCIQAHQLVSTPVQVHPLMCTRSELYPSPPTGKHTHSSAPAQNCIQAHTNCIQAHQLASAPVQAHLLRTVSKPTNWSAHPRKCARSELSHQLVSKCTRSELYPSPPTGKHTRSSAPAQNCIQAHTNCIQAHQLASAPVQAHLLRTVSKPTNW